MKIVRTDAAGKSTSTTYDNISSYVAGCFLENFAMCEARFVPGGTFQVDVRLVGVTRTRTAVVKNGSGEVVATYSEEWETTKG